MATTLKTNSRVDPPGIDTLLLKDNRIHRQFKPYEIKTFRVEEK